MLTRKVDLSVIESTATLKISRFMFSQLNKNSFKQTKLKINANKQKNKTIMQKTAQK